MGRRPSSVSSPLAQRHEALDLRLEFDKEVDPGRRAAHAESPGAVALAAVEPLGDVRSVERLHGGEVEFLDPGLLEEAADEILDHAGL
jgi:hypothetical protein